MLTQGNLGGGQGSVNYGYNQHDDHGPRKFLVLGGSFGSVVLSIG